VADLNLARALRNPGRLVLAPKQLGTTTATFPYGGKPIGLAREIALDWGLAYRRTVSHDLRQVAEVRRIAEVPVLGVTLEQWDEDVIPLVFPQVNTGTSPSGAAGMLRIEGGAAPGVVPAIDPILFCPSNRDGLFVLFARPVPLIDATRRLACSIQEDAVVPLLFVATPPANRRSYQVDKLEHLSLA
jgi:hypothetical protein